MYKIIQYDYIIYESKGQDMGNDEYKIMFTTPTKNVNEYFHLQSYTNIPFLQVMQIHKTIKHN